MIITLMHVRSADDSITQSLLITVREENCER